MFSAVPIPTVDELPAIVLGSHVTGLGAVRCLGQAGISAYLVCPRSNYAAGSRWARRLPEGVPESPDPAPLARFLESLSFERALVLPCSDDWTRAVAGLPEALRERFLAPVAAPETIAEFLDKERFAALVERLGVPHPRTAVVRRDDTQALAQFDFDAGGVQLFLKPTDSQAFVRRFGVKALAVRDEADARAKLEDVWAAGLESMLVQEYVPGPASAHYFIDGFVSADGRTPARLARRRLRMFPPDFGNSTFHVTVPLEDVGSAPAQLDRMLAATRFRGIFSAEFKRDERDGEFKVLEVNVRPWWYVHFAATCGVNVCELAHREARGLPLEPVESYRVGSHCLLIGADLRAYRHQRGPGGVGLWSWLRSWVGATRVIFSSHDPLPGVLHVREVGGRWLRRRLASRLGESRST